MSDDSFTDPVELTLAVLVFVLTEAGFDAQLMFDPTHDPTDMVLYLNTTPFGELARHPDVADAINRQRTINSSGAPRGESKYELLQKLGLAP